MLTGSPEMDTALLAGICGFVGLFIGSFLNVVIDRVPAGESVVSPRSRCPRCGTEIKAYDNIPVLSWLILRGRCRACGEPISVRYPLVELATGVLFGATAWWIGLSWQLPAFLYLAAIAVALSMIDFDTKRLPDAIVLPSYVVSFVLLGAAALAEDRWSDLLRGVLGGAAVFAFYFLLAIIKPGGMGFGDVKLGGILGLYLGWFSWGAVVVGTFAGFILGAVVGLVVMAARKGDRKTKVPFGPFMFMGTYVAFAFAQPLVDWYVGSLGL
ncbi:MAG: A24 family peptidase [Candidatus Nanopelagicales bacterium]